MSDRSSLGACAGSIGLLFVLASGCNSALGIEEAQLRPEDMGTNPASAQVTFHSGDNVCLPNAATAACSACVSSHCGSSGENHCLQDYSCRSALDTYSACLGSNCAAGTDCFESLFGAVPPGNDCYGNCEHECEGTPIYSACQLYCACLGANCMQDFGAGAQQFATQADCITGCMALPPEIVNCRRTHCEIARIYPTEPHCDHAIGNGFCGVMTTSTTRDPGCQKSLNSFACVANGDCCSGYCDVDGTRTCKDK
jgi:hypothetical protein